MSYGVLKTGQNTQNRQKFKNKLVHSPVLLQQAIKSLEIKDNGLYIDATAGEGGHLGEILKNKVKVLAIDLDENQIKSLNIKFKKEIDEKKLLLIRGNFADVEDYAVKNNFYPIDGLIVDLGLSYGQIINSGKGFSYKKYDEPLDMRIDKQTETNASEIINSFSEDRLYEIFAGNSEDINSRAIAKNIVSSRNMKKFETVGDLIKVFKNLNIDDMKTYARIFQALRMEVNNEKDNLKKLLSSCSNLIKENGRVVIITFHSIEDRIVKSFFKNNKSFYEEEPFKDFNKKDFERSALLRVYIKK